MIEQATIGHDHVGLIHVTNHWAKNAKVGMRFKAASKDSTKPGATVVSLLSKTIWSASCEIAR